MRDTVTVTVSGLTGSGKSRVLAEIEVALKAAGCPVRFATIGDQRAAQAEHWALSQSDGPVVTEWPQVVLSEQNIARKGCAPSKDTPDAD